MNLSDTILAISSPPTGRGVRGILRLSGPHAWQLAQSVLSIPPETNADGFQSVGVHGPFPIPLLHPTAKLATLLLFRAPRSFTGQDIAELHLPNSSALLKAVMEQLLQNSAKMGGGARLANPGEFSARAFFHGKIDLTEAEGIAATINAANETQLRAAAGLRTGDLHHWIAAITEKIADLLARIEAAIDFSDEEDVRFISPEALHGELQDLLNSVRIYRRTAHRLESYTDIATVVLTGSPNVGKSSLLNALTRSNRAIVSPIAGTTRDVVGATLSTRIGDIRLVDIAGVERSHHPLAEQMNAARVRALHAADVIVEVDAPDVPCDVEARTDFPAPPGTPTFRVLNKSDLPGSVQRAGPGALIVSAKTGQGLDQLREKIVELLEPTDTAGAHRAILNQRHRDILDQVAATLEAAYEISGSPHAATKHPELLAAELRRALDLLGQITGAISPDEVLGRIFSQFCIGK